MPLVAGTVIGIFLSLLAAGVWIGLSMILAGSAGLAIFRSMPVERVLSQQLFNAATATELLALPLFILMAELLFRTRISRQLFDGLAPWTRWLPGRLLHVNIFGSTLFAAVCGSSAATTSTVGRITLAELEARSYDRALATGSLAGASTIGFLIPPSLPMIVYGVLAEVSILKLFIAGIVPGLLLAAGFSLMTMLLVTLRGASWSVREDAYRPGDRRRSLRQLGPVTALVLLLIGALYGGIASPTEAAAVGVAGALLIAALSRDLTLGALKEAGLATVRTSAMLALITCGGAFLAVSLNYLGIPTFVAQSVAEAGLSPVALVLTLLVVYLVLGCVLDGMSMIVVTLPIVLPIVIAAGWDPIWFGIFLVVTIEMAQVTPPVGFNLFIIQGLTGQPIGAIARSVLPYFLVLLGLVALMIAAPDLILWLPRTM
ncbi:MAG: TRAP transporter large permease subunit [Acuticoccus sp.]